ncbi:MAG: DUF1559 domain-containing protein [Planctomycetia bacterium]|nr:DUF1559 domain-containing protein [Planctomycetia bacterium]
MGGGGRLRYPLKRVKSGFTLVELLVVIAIIGMLVGLLLPAVQQAREAARTMQCNNNLRQMGLACMNFESSSRAFPSGGWDYPWVGSPDRGLGVEQPGSWCFSILPFLEQNALFQLGSTGNRDSLPTQADVAKRLETPVATFLCPSRRSVKIFATSGKTYKESGTITQGAKNDYVANFGTQCLNPDDSAETIGNYSAANTKTSNNTWKNAQDTGVIFFHSKVTLGEIRDGTTNTYLLGEKYMNPSKYDSTSVDPGDNETLYSGACNDVLRGGYYNESNTANSAAPMQNRIDYERYVFGSCHSGAFGAAMCDGSVQRISYSIEPQIHYYLAHRSDNQIAQIPQ